MEFLKLLYLWKSCKINLKNLSIFSPQQWARYKSSKRNRLTASLAKKQISNKSFICILTTRFSYCFCFRNLWMWWRFRGQGLFHGPEQTPSSVWGEHRGGRALWYKNLPEGSGGRLRVSKYRYSPVYSDSFSGKACFEHAQIFHFEMFPSNERKVEQKQTYKM